MIEITQYKPQKNSVKQASFDIKIQKWGNFIIREMSYFIKGSSRWISFPSKQYEKDGKKQYYSYNLFEDKAMLEAFQDKVIQAIDEYLIKNPIQEPQDEFIPF